MSSLIDRELHAWASSGGVTPFDPGLINPASINLRVGNRAVVETRHGMEEISLTRYCEAVPLWVEPGGWILTDTIELIEIPSDMEALVVLRSSAARRGWDHAMAGFVDPAYRGRLTLEFVNCLRHSELPLYPGLELVQLRLAMLQREPSRGYDQTGRYHNAMGVEMCKDPRLL